MGRELWEDGVFNAYTLYGGAMTTEAYRSGDVVIIIHERKHGQVAYHMQHVYGQLTPFMGFGRMDEADFDEQVVRKARPFLAMALPALLPRN